MIAQNYRARLGLVAAIGVMLGCMALLVGGSLYQGDLSTALPGSPAPDFSLRDGDNKPVSLSDFRGDVVIVYFSPHANSERGLAEGNAPATEAAATLGAAHASARSDASAGLSQVDNTTSPDLAELSVLCREFGNDAHVKVLALRYQPTTKSELPPPTTAINTFSVSSPLIHTLDDPDGTVARQYRIDGIESSPTLFVIDRDGIIRYRGSFALGNAEFHKALKAPLEPDSLLTAPAQSSSCPKVVQALLATEAANLGAPIDE